MRKLFASLLIAMALLTPGTTAWGKDVISSSFESASPAQPPEWGLLFGGAVWNKDITASKEYSYDGDWSIRVADDSPTRGIGLRSNLTPIQPGKEYKAEAYAFNPAQAWASIYLEFWDARQTRIAHTTVGTSEVNTWTLLKAQAMAPAEAKYVSVLLYANGGNVGTSYYDQVTVSEVEFQLKGEWKVKPLTISGNSIKSLGHPIPLVQYGVTAQGFSLDGKPTWFVTSHGSDGFDHLYAYSIATGEMEADYPFPGGSSQFWGMQPLANGDVYFTGGATLFKLDASEKRVITIGRPHSNAGMIWQLSLAPDDTIYGVTYPDAHLFTVSPTEDKIVDLGSMSDQEYARSVAASETYVFVGIGSQPDIIAYDRQTGERKSILPERFRNRDTSFVRYMEVRGNRLFASAGDETNVLLVYDTQTLELVDDMYGVSTPISPLTPDGAVLLNLGNSPYRYDLETGKTKRQGLIFPNAGSLGFAELDPGVVPAARRSAFTGLNFVGFAGSRYWAVNLGSNQMLEVPVIIPPSPARINSLAFGEGKVVGGGIAPGGLFIFDTNTQDLQSTPGYGQTDSVTMLDGDLYFGTYTGAMLRKYSLQDKTKTDISAIGLNQDRPVAMLPYNGKLYVGTVPKYGMWGGVLGAYDPAKGKMDSYSNLVPDHSIVSLAGHGENLFAGTSTLGGLGKDRAPGDAALVAWNTNTQQLVWKVSPLEGEPAIGAIIVGSDNLIWGMGTHSLFAVDPKDGRVVLKRRLAPVTAGAYTWREAFTARYEHYVLMSLNKQYLVVINTRSQEISVAHGNYDRITVDDNGNLYFTRSTELFVTPLSAWQPK